VVIGDWLLVDWLLVDWLLVDLGICLPAEALSKEGISPQKKAKPSAKQLVSLLIIVSLLDNRQSLNGVAQKSKVQCLNIQCL